MSNPDEFLNDIEQTEKLLAHFKELEWMNKIKEYGMMTDQNCQKSEQQWTEEEQKLERQLEVLKVMESEIVQDYHHLIEKNETSKIREVEIEGYTEKQNVDIEELNREIEVLEGQIENLDDSYSIDTQPFELVNAVFTGLGVKAKVKGDRVTKVELASYDKQSICTLDITKYSDAFITNFIWRHISKGLDMS